MTTDADRDIPPILDSELHRRAQTEGRRLNAIAIEAMVRGAGPGETLLRQRDLSDVAGTWKEDRDFDEAIADHNRIDERLWR